jgi:hypothetical protein
MATATQPIPRTDIRVTDMGVTRCLTACVVPTQGPDLADQAALAEYANARDQSLRMKIATRWQIFRLFAVSGLSLAV